MLIPKGFAWAVVDEKGELIVSSLGDIWNPVCFVFSTREQARHNSDPDVESVVKVKIEIIK